MATLEPICEQEWERHKEVLQGMYCKENLPLLNRKGNGNEPGVAQLMKERHGFVASPSQYELQFKKWGFTKNLKSGEWAALISQYDRLRQTKSDVRITVSGSVFSKDKIEKARRRYRLQHDRTQSAICKGGALPVSRQAYVEFLDESGGWTRYSGAQAKSSIALILRKSGHTARDTAAEDGHRPETRPKDTGSTLLHDRPLDLSLPFHESFPVTRPLSPSMNVDDLFNNLTLTFDDCLLSSLPSGSGDLDGLSHASASCSNSTTRSIVSNHSDSSTDYQDFGLEGAAIVTKSHLERARAFITSLVQHGKMTLSSQMGRLAETQMPDVDDIMEALNSLLPKTQTPSQEFSDLILSTRSACPSSQLFRTLLYSFTNNFAGLRDVPRASIMHLIREHHDIRTQLLQVIKSGQPGTAKALADSFFRAAVEGNDADAAGTIIRHTKYNPNVAISPNDIVCNSEGEDYTPIELAAKFRNTELVRTLLASGADPNKTYKPDDEGKEAQGALGLALGHWDNGSTWPFQPSESLEPVNLGLLKLLLDHAAEIRIDLAENAMRPGTGNTAIAEELISRIPANNHKICFKSQWLLISATHYLENNAAYKMIRRLFAHCFQSQDCGNCISENQRLVEKLLCHAARRANSDLAQFLAQHTAKLQSGLAAAIRASSDELVEFFLSKGARVDAPVESFQLNHSEACCPHLYDEDGYDRSSSILEEEHQEYVITPIRKPLAEAIRSRNRYLFNSFERLGACERLSDEHHFHAAVLAAAEVGDTCYLNTVLNHAPSHNDGIDLTLALAVAVRNDETECALILLSAGANWDPTGITRRYGDPLVIALERFNNRVVDYMLECDIRITPSPVLNSKSTLEAAATWGDLGLISDLMNLGGDIDTGGNITPLGVAVRTRDKTFVSGILDLRADPKRVPQYGDGVTPLQAAMETGDFDLVRFLVSKGAPPADVSAFLYAMSHDPMGYEFLLSMFKTQHPHGLQGFGAQLFARAIELGSQPLLHSLLGAGADTNSWCEMRSINTRKPMFKSRKYTLHRYRPLGLAIRHGRERDYEILRALLHRGADPNLLVYEYERVRLSGLIWFRETPLLVAIHLKKLGVVRMLLEYGADLNRPARRGVKQTPLQAACETGSYRMVEFLLQKGARVNDEAAERYGGTALQFAAESGSLKIVRLLLDNGADPFMPKSKVGGRTAFAAAAENGCIDVLCQLWNAVLPLGFSQKECQSAKELAKQKGHRGCAEFIDFLSGGSSQSFLNA